MPIRGHQSCNQRCNQRCNQVSSSSVIRMPTRCRELEEIAEGRRGGIATSNHSDGPPPRAVWWQEGGNVVPEHIGDLMKVFIRRNQRFHQASSDVIRCLIRRNQRSHQAHRVEEDIPIRGLIRRNQRSHQAHRVEEDIPCTLGDRWLYLRAEPTLSERRGAAAAEEVA